mmetsp:Transcript_7608/g.11924  ORF Transcript_7608/g.11924 Transcript_7608/m.11924 type:complete len:307 (-) Transcript_7608:320-1240(-)
MLFSLPLRPFLLVLLSFGLFFLSVLLPSYFSLRFSVSAFRPICRRQHHTSIIRTSSLLRMMSNTNKRYSPSADRNKGPIWNVLEQNIFSSILASVEEEKEKDTLRVLEIAAGAGVHSYHFSSELLSLTSSSNTKNTKNIQWYATDPEESSIRSIEAYRDDSTAAVKNILQPPLCLTLGSEGILQQQEEDNNIMTTDLIPDSSSVDVVICINMIHISPWEATVGLMKTARKLLKPGGYMYCYGPYKENGTAVDSNLSFDMSLKSRDPSWGVRNLEDVVKLAQEQGLNLVKRIEMPANNLSVIYQLQV